jgi:hypothetical protein
MSGKSLWKGALLMEWSWRSGSIDEFRSSML